MTYIVDGERDLKFKDQIECLQFHTKHFSSAMGADKQLNKKNIWSCNVSYQEL